MRINMKWYSLNPNLNDNYLKLLLNNSEFNKIKNIKLLFNNLYSILNVLSKHIDNIHIYHNELVITLKSKDSLTLILLYLKNHYKYQFKELVDICTVDYLNIKDNKRFEINYILLSLKYFFRLRIKLYVEEQEIVNSITNLYSSANWLERENWDLFGIYFYNHPDLRRILTDYGFEGFPFRKDFPLSGYIELRYDDEKRVVVYESLELAQEFRLFNFASPWDWNEKINKKI